MEAYFADQARACKDRYSELEAKCRVAGVDKRSVEVSRTRDSQIIGEHVYLKGHAFKPTGVALGCPLPDPRFERCLYELCFSVDQFLSTLTRSGRSTVALVPPAFYHVTLVNRDHFDLRGDDTSVRYITPREKIIIDKSISTVGMGSYKIKVRFSGVMMTASGRLIIPGYPLDDQLFRLRSTLYDSMISLRCNVPKTAHIKIGHVLAPLSVRDTAEFYGWMTRTSRCLESVLSFPDVYTPIGRISF
jgi:hypothetical protein